MHRAGCTYLGLPRTFHRAKGSFATLGGQWKNVEPLNAPSRSMANILHLKMESIDRLRYGRGIKQYMNHFYH